MQRQSHYSWGAEHGFWLEKLIHCYRETPCLAQATHLSPYAGLGPGHLAVKLLCWCPLKKTEHWPSQILPPDKSSCPLACHTSRQHNCSSKVRTDGKANEFCVQVHVARVLCNVKRNCCWCPGFGLEQQHTALYFILLTSAEYAKAPFPASVFILEAGKELCV